VPLEFNSEEYQNEQTLFADVILPLPLPLLYTYRVPREFSDKVKQGLRVVVQFGKKRVMTAVISAVHHNPPKIYEAKYLLDLLDESPTVNSFQFRLFEWMAAYYMCTQGEVLNAAIPSGLKLSSESKIQLNPEYAGNYEFSASEQLILDELQKKNLSYNDVMTLLGKKTIHSIIKSLLAKGTVILFEELKDKYSPKVISKIRLKEEILESKALFEEVFHKLEKKEKQLTILLRYMQLTQVQKDKNNNRLGLAKNVLLNADVSASALSTLIKNNIFEEYDQVISRFVENDLKTEQEIKLSEEQIQAKEKILESFKTKEVTLLHGITGSGKTEVYIELIKHALQGGSQVLLLLPEIALTTQIVSRLHKVFGSKMGIYHSKFSDNERVEVWRGIISGKFSFIIGVRSSVFLPFDNLGLLIVDEEHESSYKQYEPTPRYHARDTALMLGRFHHAKVVLGSATPSVESYHQATIGKWGFVKLDKRFGEAQLPEILLVDTLREKKFKTMRNDFSSALLDDLTLCLNNNEQAILFQNRRGYAPYLNCEECAYIPKCTACSVSLTYHMHSGELRCHYCGFIEKLPQKCDACGSVKMKPVGFGTEKLEDDLKLFLPEARVQRMDLDTTRNKNAYQNIIQDFESGKTNVLVGTQMVTKGLDFDKVTLVGIFDADRMIHFPDFRAAERAFQVLSQVSGRAGRRGQKGKVLIQTTNTNQTLLYQVMKHDYEGFYEMELAEREKFNYPPFYRIIKITIKDPDKKTAHEFAEAYVKTLAPELGSKRVLGPETPIIDRIRNNYLVDIFIKLEKDKINLTMVKELLQRQSSTILQLDKSYRNVHVVFDVDPA
jgi:primosomal protein N' (replication factor Y)